MFLFAPGSGRNYSVSTILRFAPGQLLRPQFSRFLSYTTFQLYALQPWWQHSREFSRLPYRHTFLYLAGKVGGIPHFWMCDASRAHISMSS